MSLPPTFAELLRSWMGERTRAEAAMVLGVSWGTVDNWLRGSTQPAPCRASVLAMLMGIDAAQIRAALEAPATPVAPAVGDGSGAGVVEVACPQSVSTGDA